MKKAVAPLGWADKTDMLSLRKKGAAHSAFLCGYPTSDNSVALYSHADMLRLQARIRDLERICGESYQVMGVLASESDRFEDAGVVKALDNLSSARLMHRDVLPFESKKP